MDKFIDIIGARTHNLKNINLKIPRGKITAILGVSGAGKTSLAFNTIYAEGYTRYIESISPYVRQFLEKIEKPAVDKIEGLPPAIAFRHKKPAKNPRSIVATSLDIFDYLRILYAKISDFFCPTCGKKIKKYSIDEIITELLAQYSGKVDICFSYSGDIAFLINRGYYYYVDAGQKKRIDHQVKKRHIDILIDSVEIKNENKSRLFEALDKSISLGNKGALLYYNDKALLFPSDLFCPECSLQFDSPDEHLFSFNSPKGACPECKGFGDIQSLDPYLIFDSNLSISEGGIKPFNSPATRAFGISLFKEARRKGINVDLPIGQLSDKERLLLLNGDSTLNGIKSFFDWLKTKSYKIQARVFISRYSTYQKCIKCNGTRLNDYTRSFKINDRSITDILALTIQEANDFFNSIDPFIYKDKVSPEVFFEIQSRLHFLVETGLSYIHLNRPTFSLSRGEYQRINLAFILGSTLSDSLLILDQPSSDLHPYDYEKLKTFLYQLKSNDNTVLLIEHNRDIGEMCDHILELGPFSGEDGGEIIFDGAKDIFFDRNSISSENTSKTLTQQFFLKPFLINEKSSLFKQWIEIKNANSHNLKNISVHLPLNAFTVIVGVSGAGKTSLLYNEIYLQSQIPGKQLHENIKDTIFIDPGIQKIRNNTNVASYFEIFSAIREIYASLKESRLLNYTPGHFSYNSPHGRCEHCIGKGFNEVEMQFLPAVEVLCNQCDGTGYKTDILKIKYKNQNIHQVLNLSIDKFIETMGAILPEPKLNILLSIKKNGLGYVTLGQRLNTFSGGEIQRLKLIKSLNLKKTKTLFLIDEPAFGMHPYDIEKVKRLIDNLLSNGNTVIAAEHNMSLISHSDYIIELGPTGGSKGGHLIFQGYLQDILKSPYSITGTYLKKNSKNT